MATCMGPEVATPIVKESHRCNGCWNYVEGKQLRQCTACNMVNYCSLICQKEHWDKHKPFCQIMEKNIRSRQAEAKGTWSWIGWYCLRKPPVTKTTP